MVLTNTNQRIKGVLETVTANSSLAVAGAQVILRLSQPSFTKFFVVPYHETSLRNTLVSIKPHLKKGVILGTLRGGVSDFSVSHIPEIIS